MSRFTLPEEVLGVPLWVPDANNYFEVESDAMPNGDPCLVMRGDLSTSYKAFLPAPLMSPRDVCNKGDVFYPNTSWAMSCWLKLSNLASSSDNSILFGCSRHNASLPFTTDVRNVNVPFALGTHGQNSLTWFREVLNSVIGADVNLRVSNPFQTAQDYWVLVVINHVIGASGGGIITATTYLDTYETALAADTALNSGMTNGGAFTNSPPKYLHIGAYHSGGLSRPDLWRMAKWAFHDHALSVSERKDMWDAMMGNTIVYTDDFDRASLGVYWQTLTSAFSINSNQAFQDSSTGSHRMMSYIRDIGNVDMYSQVVVHQHGGGVYVMTRVTPFASTASSYIGGYSRTNAAWRIERMVSGTPTVLATLAAAVPATPCTIRLETTTVGGNVNLDLYANGVLVLSAIDSSGSKRLIQSNAGLDMLGHTSLPENAVADNFECGSL